MLKLRLKRIGRKASPSYRLVIMENSSRRDGKSIDEVGFYNPITKQSFFDSSKIQKWLTRGAEPSQTVLNLLNKAGIIGVL
jgi:small subunit ribosomal protein S16